MNTKQKMAVLDLFKKAIAEEKEYKNEATTIELLRYGFVCDKNTDHATILQWVKDNHFNPNTTFYQTISDVIEKSRLELFIDQILHYFTSYTLEMEKPFIVNDEPVDLKKMNVTHIGTLSKEEVFERCLNMLYSGVALKQDTIEKTLIIVGDDIDIDKVKNREAQAIISVNKGIYPNDAESVLRCLVYQATNKTPLIKDPETIKTLKEGNVVIPEYLIPKLSEIFFRFKPIFLAMKKGNQYKINRMRRLASQNHQPFIMPFWNRIINTLNKLSKSADPTIFDLINKNLDKLTIYKMIALYNLINIKLNVTTYHNLFIIRNGKIYVKDEVNALSEDLKERLKKLNEILYERIVETVKNNVGNEVVKLPLNINLVCPTSEKNFMGEIPLYSWVDLNFDNTIIGIHWREKDGARDLDLSFIDKSGIKIGWNANYYDENKQFVYSGDMTSANPEATELLYKKKNNNQIIGSVKVNPYSFSAEMENYIYTKRVTHGKAKYKVFFAKENIEDKLVKNYMVHTDSIVYSYDDIIEGEKLLGTFLNDKFVFANIQTSKKRVSSIDNINGVLLDIFKQKQPYYLTLDRVLKDAQVNLQYNKENVLSKDYILKLFQK